MRFCPESLDFHSQAGDVTLLFGSEQDAEDAGNCELHLHRGCASFTLIEQRAGSIDLDGQGDGFTLPFMQVHA